MEFFFLNFSEYLQKIVSKKAEGRDSSTHDAGKSPKTSKNCYKKNTSFDLFYIKNSHQKCLSQC